VYNIFTTLLFAYCKCNLDRQNLGKPAPEKTTPIWI